MDTERVTLVAVGDILIDREKPESIFTQVAPLLRSGDITFGNCEQMYSDRAMYWKATATYSDPRNIPALVDAGFDVLSLANNHTLDVGPEALLDTIVRLKAAGLHPVGAGKDLGQARQPVVLDRKGTKVGFLAYGCTGPDAYEAGEDKPGYAPVRSWTIYEKVDYQPATPPRIVSFPRKEDLSAMMSDIEGLKTQVDVVVASFHWGQHFIPAVIPMYCYEVGRAAVDAGADLILGGHPHILKGAEVYKGKVIFYSTGNFAIEAGEGKHKGDMPRVRKLWREIYKYTPDPTYIRYVHHPESKTTMIAKAYIEDGQIKDVRFIPCYINKWAEPEVVTREDWRGQEVFSYMQKISEHENLNVHFEWVGDEIRVLP